MMNEHASSFGTWVATKRGEVSRRHYAQCLNIDFGTLKRTEEAKGEIMLSSAVRICRGMAISFDTMLEEWQHRRLPTSSSLSQDTAKGDILTQQDVLHWVRAIVVGDEQAHAVLAAVLNRVAEWNDMPVKGKGDRYLFGANDIEKLLLDVPWMRYNIAFPSPPSITLDTLFTIIQCNGALLQPEIGAAIALYRERHELSSMNLQAATGITLVSLRSLEAGDVAYLKLQDILRLDEALGRNGIVFALYWHQEWFRQEVEEQWHVLKRYRKQASLDRFFALVALIVSACRWLQYREQAGWLTMIRDTIAAAPSLPG